MKNNLFTAITLFQIACIICIVLVDNPLVDIIVLIVQCVIVMLYIIKIRKFKDKEDI